ncbi:MAG: sugar transporter [Betaproteobacteria bacterium]|nr:sugar transporter [Betaproteobacteria bacterium]
MRLLAGLVACLALSSCMTACGQRGPLVLPPKKAQAAPVIGATASAALQAACPQ